MCLQHAGRGAWGCFGVVAIDADVTMLWMSIDVRQLQEMQMAVFDHVAVRAGIAATSNRRGL